MAGSVTIALGAAARGVDSGSVRPRPSTVSAATTTLLPDGRHLTPAGTLVSAGDFPAAALLHSNVLYTATIGESENRLGAFTGSSLTAQFVTPHANGRDDQSGSLALSPNGKSLYAAGGKADAVYAFRTGPNPTQIATYNVPGYAGGVVASHDGVHLFVSLPFDTVQHYNRGHQVAWINMRTGNHGAIEVGRQPQAMALGELPHGREVLAVANRGAGSVSLIDTSTLTVFARVHTGAQPAALAFVSGGTQLLVVDSLDDLVVDIRLSDRRVVSRLSVGSRWGIGSAPSAITVNRAGNRVYVSLSQDNAVAVVGRRNHGHTWSMSLLGRIPTAVYPTAVALDEAHHRLLVTAGKGVEQGAGAPAGKPVPPGAVHTPGYISAGVSGTVERIAVPGSHALRGYTAQVAADNHWNAQGAVHLPKAITHVVYILRENKTYDQEFGDLPGGVTDSTMYPYVTTPNAHRLATQYALLERYYSDEEVSDTGHQAIMGATVNDWVERLTQQSYGGRALFQDVEDGNGDPILWSPGKYLLDDALAHHISFRDYGEFYRLAPTTHYQPYFGAAISRALDQHIVHNFPGFGFNLAVPDSARVAFWLKAFQSDVVHHTFPQLEVLYLPEDHTGGDTSTPQQQVADSDLATGKVVEALSHSPYWRHTAVFLTEDDPQSGTDHVDQHRTLGLVVSPWIAPGTRATQHYDQAGMLRTIEQILHLPPMTEFDRTARSMAPLFSTGANPPNITPYTVSAPKPALMSAPRLQQYRTMVRTLLGPHPDWSTIPPNTQFRLQWFATRG